MQFLHCFCHFQALTVSRESSRSTLNRVSAIEFLLNLCGMASNLDIFCSETGSCFTCISGVYMVKSDPNSMFDQSPSLTSTWQYSVIIIATYWQRKLHLYYMTLHLFLDVLIQGGWTSYLKCNQKSQCPYGVVNFAVSPWNRKCCWGPRDARKVQAHVPEVAKMYI